MSSKQPVPLQLLPFQAENVATNQQSVPVPYMAGMRLVALRWITPALNGIAQPAKSNGKKG